ALGFALAAIQILPLYELVSLNFRAGSVAYGDVAGWALPSRQILTFFIPDFFGNPTHHAYFDIFDFTWQAAPQGTIFWGIKNYVEAGAYIGILAMALAVLGVFNSKVEHRNSKFFFLLLAALSLLFAFGTPLYAILFYGLPGWNQLHTPFRWIFPWTLSMAFLAGLGAQALANGFSKRLVTIITILLAAIGALTLLVIASSLALRDVFVRFADAFVNASDLAKPVFETGQAFWSYEARNLASFGIFVSLAGFVFFVARANFKVRRTALWKPLALFVLVADLFVVGIGFYPRADAKLADFTPPAIQFLQQDKSLYRIATYDLPGQKVLNANSAMPFHLQDIRGYDSIIAKQYVEYMNLLAPQDELLYNRIAAFYDYKPLSSSLLNLLGVKYIVTTRAVPNPGYTLVYDREVKIYENKNVLPRAFLVNHARAFANRDELLNALPTLDPTREVWLETASLPPLLSSPAPLSSPSTPLPIGEGSDHLATIEKYTGSEVIVKTRSAQPAYLVLTDSYFPGWIAQIDGQDTPIYRADGNFRAVAVPVGENTVRFKFSPISFRVGAVISLLAVIAVLLAF